TLLSADEGIADLLDALEATGRLSNTLIVFASDNGLTLGQFNLLGAKNYPYASPIPLVMRWDDAPVSSVLADPGEQDSRLVALPDIAATALDAAGIKSTESMDGLSLLSARSKRSSLILSAAANRSADEGNATMPPYCARRTSRWL
ncbi:MAG: sulfatase-like hydrolase/transferase, partial [Candidatus Nanopelagicales bacterium]